MAKESDVKLTRFELEVMGALWELGSASVRELQERLPEGKRPAYTTVQTIVYRLEEKGAVRRVKKVGNAHVFEPVVTRRATVRRLFGELLGFFGGSPRSLMAQLVEAGHLTLEDLRETEETLARLEAEKAGAADGGAAEGGTSKGAGGAASRKGSGEKGRGRR
ncbi:MAG TPA: BlaI/MecI/CopY family transcriptional regulator [Pyrinomonadaceae bacterium]